MQGQQVSGSEYIMTVRDDALACLGALMCVVWSYTPMLPCKQLQI